MGNKITLRTGDIVSGMEVLGMVVSEKQPRNKCLLRCHCGKEFVTVTSVAARGLLRSCGCARYKNRRKRITHKIDEHRGIAYISMTGGKVAKIDIRDYDTISAHKWQWSNGYAVTKINRKTTLMHTIIMGCMVDHVNGNKLDNTRANLRAASVAENNANRTASIGGTSPYLGVCRCHGGLFRARIKKNGETYSLGNFETEEEAALAYNEAAKKLHGEFARLNKI